MIASLDLLMLGVEQQGRLREISLTPEMATGAALANKSNTTPGIVRTGATGTTVPGTLALNTSDGLPGGSAPGRASASDSADGAQLEGYKARQRILLDKLRRDAIEVQREAADKFRAGQQDDAMEKLQDFIGTLNGEQLESNQLVVFAARSSRVSAATG